MKKNYNIYVSNKKTFENEVYKDYLIKETLNVKTVDKGILLPPKKIIDNEKNGIYGGGVATKDGKFVAGLIRKVNDKRFNISCYESYKVNTKNIDYRDEEVIFGGILIHMFGHTLIEGFSRLWYVIKNKDDKRKIVFLKLHENAKDFGFLKLLNLEDRVEIIEKPIKFRKVIVPEESFHAYTGYHKEWTLIYDEIMKNIKPKSYKKIYLTRTALEKKDCINEEYFEQFYKNMGYEVISPEKYPIEEQIAFFKGAKEVACTVGTLSHMVLFCNNNIKLTILNRTENDIITPQFIIEQARNLNVDIIDISMNVFPTTHRYGGIFLFMPNKNFIKYVEKNNYQKYNNIPFEKEKIFYEYMLAWGNLYYSKNKYKYIYQNDLGDLLQNINKYMLDMEEKPRKKLYSKDISKKDLLNKYDRKNSFRKILIKTLIKLNLYEFAKKIVKKYKGLKKH